MDATTTTATAGAPRATARPPRPSTCQGPADHEHRKGCRHGRPLCKWRRKALAARWGGLCTCTAYHFPHRSSRDPLPDGTPRPAGLCGNDAAYEEFLKRPHRRAA